MVRGVREAWCKSCAPESSQAEPASPSCSWDTRRLTTPCLSHTVGHALHVPHGLGLTLHINQALEPGLWSPGIMT